MRRVVVTGLGIVSSIGSNAEEVAASLHDAKSGISFSGSSRAFVNSRKASGVRTKKQGRVRPTMSVLEPSGR